MHFCKFHNKYLLFRRLTPWSFNYLITPHESYHNTDLLSKSEFFQIMTKKLGKFMETLAFFPKADKMGKR